MDRILNFKKKITENNLNENLNCIVINPETNFYLSSEKVIKKVSEIYNLAKSINLKIKEIKTIKIRRIIPSFLFGKGQVENIKILLNRQFSKLLIVNSEVSPIQQRNLEKKLNCKILDRTALILEIFGERATTKQGRIQVELAALLYQKTRLVRSWTHLERQRGGAGFMGGPGEKQIESDKRQIDKKIIKLKKELKKIELNRNVQRKQRNKSSIPIISLIGYTNAGKSTLFNYLASTKIPIVWTLHDCWAFSPEAFAWKDSRVEGDQFAAPDRPLAAAKERRRRFFQREAPVVLVSPSLCLADLGRDNGRGNVVNATDSHVCTLGGVTFTASRPDAVADGWNHGYNTPESKQARL